MFSHWISHPTKKQLIIIISIWVIALLFIVMGITNVFTKQIKVSGVFIILAMITVIPSFLAVLQTIKNYKKSTRKFNSPASAGK
jgi:hypothetical protein